ncbi:MAG: 16S rRNA (adenine(1518)-N(6)/adenine(1519)-N(6))-dimethyltransferase RsmA [Clostridiales bacterium]|nr:16S rRNA (adenine(1518)-N(6)/adenine(1519)-N(6))-dimethyltransferase RsmA [Clostridia bacterium]MCR4563359.1 16S rRNA (adenine(1518)-N(6)/adenine(1519)-N(6))-dimethyltransferase RsmA [Clostridiales bacterium]
MYNLSDISTVKRLLEQGGFHFSKSLGQNFLIDGSVCPKMADEAVSDGETGVLEIGAGIGVLTSELSKRAEKVVSVELDARLLPILSKTLGEYDNIEIINEDILKVDLPELLKEKFGDRKVSVCANLPYYITSPVIMKLLESRLPIEKIVVMVQKEAADRICANVGDRESGALTAAVNYYSKAEKLFFVSKESFIPSPKVDSEVISLRLLKNPPVNPKDISVFGQVVKSAFAQRRKTAVNSLSAGLGIEKSVISDILKRLGFDENIRAERFTMTDFEKISDAVYEYRNKG